MAIRHVIALAVFGFLNCCLAGASLGETPTSADPIEVDTPDTKDEPRDEPEGEKTPSVAELESKVRQLEARAPKGVPYDTALTELYDAYLKADRDADAASTARKLWQLREKELGPSDTDTISAMQDVADALLRDDAGTAEAGRILEQALGRLSRLQKRSPSYEVSVLNQMAYLASLAQPAASDSELDILDKMTGIIEGNVGAFDHDALIAHRLRVKKFIDRVPKADTRLHDRAASIGRKAWLAHEAFAIGRWEAYRRTNKPWSGKESHPAEALAAFYSDQKLGEGPGTSFLFFSVAGADILDQSVDPATRAAKALDVLPRVVDAELKMNGEKAHEHALKSLSAILDATVAAASAPGTSDKLAAAGKLFLAFTVERDGRYSEGHLEALERVLTAYDVVAPQAAHAIAAERDAVNHVLEAQQLFKRAVDALRPRPASNQPDGDADTAGGNGKVSLSEATDRLIEAYGKDSPDLGNFLTSQLEDMPNEDTALELMQLLANKLPPGSRLVLGFASKALAALVKRGREHEAFQLGRSISAQAEQAFGLQDPITRDILTEMLVPALKFSSDAERQDLLAKLERAEVSPSDHLIQLLLEHGTSEAALRQVWRKIRSEAGAEQSGNSGGSPRALELSDYELISVLGRQSDLLAFADIVETGITRSMNAKPDPNAWLFPSTEESLRYLRSLREDLLALPKAIRGACDAGVNARQRISAARSSWLKRKTKDDKADFAALTLIVMELLTERATMDCLARGGRLAEAAQLLKTSTLMKSLATLNKGSGPTALNPLADLRAALVLASASDWAAVENSLKQLVAARRTDVENRKRDFPDEGGRASPSPAPRDRDLYDTLAARKYAPGMRATQLLAATYLKALWRTKGTAAPREDVDRAFQLAQRTELSTATAIARMAARGLGGPELADKVRRLQDLEDEANRLALRASSLADAGNDSVGKRLAEIANARVDIEAEISQAFPRYYELIKPRAMSLGEVQNLLTADEALIMTTDSPPLLSTPEETFTIVVTRNDVGWARSALGTEALAREVTALRCGLDEEEWAATSKARRCADLLGLASAPDPSRPLPFHLGKAHALYQALLGPVEKLIAGKRLLVVASGPLTSLPLGVLVTEKPRRALPDTFDQYVDVSWLAARNAIVTLPAVSSLSSLREQLEKQPAAPEQYAGYGNPVLTGDSRYCRPIKSPTRCPSIEDGQVRVAASEGGGERATIRGRGGRRSGDANIEHMYAAGAGSAAVLDQVRALCPLPDTEYEITCVAARFNESGRLLRLKADAREQDIKSLSESGKLARYRILHFATHGLLSGDVQQITKRQGEPALVLTPPTTPENADDDGLLTASEVAALKLNADWVVLSACNTAAGDKIGAEALSGLARSFFFAGARSLLVSHWPVYSDAAVLLSTRAFAELDRDQKIGRAEALQRAMVALMKDRSQNDNAHPAVWAPFVLVGEGRR